MGRKWRDLASIVLGDLRYEDELLDPLAPMY